MARKGNQQKNALSRQLSNHNKGVSGPGFKSQNAKGSKANIVAPNILPNGTQQSTPLRETETNGDPVVCETQSKQECEKLTKSEKPGLDTTNGLDREPYDGYSEDCIREMSSMKESFFGGENATLPNYYNSPNNLKRSVAHFWTRLHTDGILKNVGFANGIHLVLGWLESGSKASSEWIESQKPWFISLVTSALRARDNVRSKVEYGYPIILGWLWHFGNIMLVISMLWLESAIRGIDSFLCMGTTSFFLVIWCSILSIVAMIGLFKFVLLLATAILMAFLVGFAIAILLVAICGIISLWIYGSFLTTMLMISCAGLAFKLKHERLALFVTTIYSVYCAWTYVGCLGLLLGLNLSFVSSDILMLILKNSIDEQRRPSRTPEQRAGVQDQHAFSGEPMQNLSSEAGSGLSADRSSGIPSTSGSDSEITSEDEVARMLNCTNHYSALGLSRFGDVDASVLKREYRKKAMLVHPDKNMGNKKAAEAFKKLQNAYEVLLDSFKRKAYDDELRKEDLLNYLRRFQDTSQKNRGHGFFTSGFTRGDANSEEEPLGPSRRIACRKCNSFHFWVLTRKLKLRARWCQDCKDFHQAKDGDGWVEQSARPFFFGILQKIDIPAAYVCADSKIYDATEWYICQGMRCPVNAHKPSFHVNGSVTSKHNSGKGASSGQKGGAIPTQHMEETIKEEFFEWLQNAVQVGMFDNFAGGAPESPTTHAAHSSKNVSGSSRKKKKGKKQW